MPDRGRAGGAWPAGTHRPDVLAAGGVVVRERDGRSEVVVVHRPRYDDWSLPKGKLDRGETALDAARREVAEETGLTVVPVDDGAPAVVRYVDGKGRAKEVRYWRMRVDGDDGADPADLHEPDDEVDIVAWWPLERALAALTYEHDRALLWSLADPTAIDGTGGAGL